MKRKKEDKEENGQKSSPSKLLVLAFISTHSTPFKTYIRDENKVCTRIGDGSYELSSAPDWEKLNHEFVRNYLHVGKHRRSHILSNLDTPDIMEVLYTFS